MSARAGLKAEIAAHNPDWDPRLVDAEAAVVSAIRDQTNHRTPARPIWLLETRVSYRYMRTHGHGPAYSAWYAIGGWNIVGGDDR